MKASPVLAALAMVAGGLLLFHARAQEETDPASRQVQLKKGDRIIFFGDSLTALAIKDSHVPDGKGYVPLVRAALAGRETCRALASGRSKA
jgi:hypothetical protein